MRWYYLLFLLLFLPFVKAVTCGGVVDVNTSCVMVSPSLSCGSYTFNVSNSSLSQVSNGNLSIYPGDSLYSFNFSMPYEDTFLIQLCDGSTRQIIVSNGGDSMLLGFLALLPLLFGFGLLYWANNLDEELSWLKLLFRLLFIPLFLLAVRFGLAGVSAVYPTNSELVTLLADVTYYVGWLLYIVGACLLIYIVWMVVKLAVGKKVEKNNAKYGDGGKYD